MLEGTNSWHKRPCELYRLHGYEVVKGNEDKIAIELETSSDLNEEHIA